MELNGLKREKTGKAANSLRKQGLVPAVIFGKHLESQNISVKAMEFGKLYAQAGETTLIDINIEDKPTKVLVKDVTFNPVTDAISHISFYLPNLSEKTSAAIPVEVIGEDKNPLVKSGEAVVLTLIQEIQVEALPMDLPHAFVVDVTALTKVGDTFTMKDLQFDKEKVEIVGYEPDELIVKLDSAVMAQTEEEIVDEAAALEKLEATAEKKPEEGEEAEGAKGSEGAKSAGADKSKDKGGKN